MKLDATAIRMVVLQTILSTLQSKEVRIVDGHPTEFLAGVFQNLPD